MPAPILVWVLAGGYALVAHELVARPSRDIDFATATALPMSEVVARLLAAYEQHGFAARVVECTPRMARVGGRVGVRHPGPPGGR